MENIIARFGKSRGHLSKNDIAKAMLFLDGWSGGTRTPEWRDQNPLPYHLATLQWFIFYHILRKNAIISLWQKRKLLRPLSWKT